MIVRDPALRVFRAAANSFLEMSRHLDPADPLREVALDMANALLEALENHARPSARESRPKSVLDDPNHVIIERPRNDEPAPPSTEEPADPADPVE